MHQFTDKEIQIRRLALGLSGLPCNDAAAETTLLVEEHMNRLGEKFSIKESTQIEYYITKKYHSPKITVNLTDVKKKKANSSKKNKVKNE